VSTIPFLYIVWELFKGLGASIERQPESVKKLIKTARLVTFASWGFYPIVFFAPFMGLTGGSVETTIQVGYTIADLVAKAGIGILIFLIAVRKSESDTDGVKGHAA
jgi:bacteriorhodopsin